MDAKKLSEERAAALEDADVVKKKMLREMETMQQHSDELQANNSKLEKARKRLQNEVSNDTGQHSFGGRGRDKRGVFQLLFSGAFL